MIKKYKHILWDWNGTLLDDTWLCHELVNHSLLTQNLEAISLEKYRSMTASSVEDFYIQLGFDFAIKPFKTLSQEWHDLYESRRAVCKLHENVTDILAEVKKAGIQQTVLSALNKNLLHKGVKDLAIQMYFAEVIGQEDLLVRGKVESGKMWFADKSLKGEEVCIIGDTLHDYEVAEALGIDCILVANGLQSREILGKQPCRVYDSLEELELDAK